MVYDEMVISQQGLNTPTFCISCSHSWGFGIDRGGCGADGASLRPTENKHLNYCICRKKIEIKKKICTKPLKTNFTAEERKLSIKKIKKKKT